VGPQARDRTRGYSGGILTWLLSQLKAIPLWVYGSYIFQANRACFGLIHRCDFLRGKKREFLGNANLVKKKRNFGNIGVVEIDQADHMNNVFLNFLRASTLRDIKYPDDRELFKLNINI
jgi:hypothetical protein